MSDLTGFTRFNFPEMSWTEYIKYRPLYPPALYSLVFNYHAAHSGGHEKAYDIGAGAGIVAKELINSFAHVTVSDPMTEYQLAARKLLAQVPAERVSFAQHAGEQPLQAEPASLDLITAAECLHWTDVTVAVQNLAKYLKPQTGTLAIWMYGTHMIPRDNTGPLFEAYERMYARWVSVFDGRIQSKSRSGANMNARFDNLDFDPAVWSNVRRLKWVNDVVACAESQDTAPSAIRPGEEVQELEDREFLHVKADRHWIVEYFVNLIPPLYDIFKEEAKEEIAAFEALLGDQTITMVWPTVLLLATRK